jgi:hypothetical protein
MPDLVSRFQFGLWDFGAEEVREENMRKYDEVSRKCAVKRARRRFLEDV